VVTAGNSDDAWNKEGASLGLEFQPFFYQTRLFYLTGGMAVVALLLGTWRVRVRQYKSRERELAGLVAHKTEELRQANGELLQLAHSDGLTGVANRRRFEEFLADEWRRAIRSREPVSLLILDLDDFKLFNDTYGHHAGDECLKSVATALKATMRRPTDLVARFGGEEFAIVLGGTDLDGALIVARQAMNLVLDLKIPHRASPTSGHVTVSVGVAATAVTTGMSESELIKAADAALYRAKADGRNRICC
jgi:diguanylate cyclase (GGDEF)-like protein